MLNPPESGRRSKSPSSSKDARNAPKSGGKRPTKSKQQGLSPRPPGGKDTKKEANAKREKENGAGMFSMIYDDENNEIPTQDAPQETLPKESVAMPKEKKLQLKFGHQMYDNAATVFGYLTGEISASALPSFVNEYQKRRAYSVAFATKRYEEVLKEVLADSNFYSMFSHLQDSHHNNVMVLLMDFHDHNFRFSDSGRITLIEDTENPIEVIREIQGAIICQQVHIAAAFARCRIRECAVCLEDLLKDSCKETQKYAQQQPLYARVNTLKATVDDVARKFLYEGFQLAEDVGVLELRGKMFRKDPHFEDMLVFSRDCKDDVYSHNMSLDLWLYPQDKSKYVIVEAMKSLLLEMAASKDKADSLVAGEMKSFLTDGDDVLLTNPDAGTLSAHLASFINPERKLFICGCFRDAQKTLENKILASGVRNFELIDEAFTNIPHHDERLKRVRIILCNVPCSKSGVVNPVDFIFQEGITAAKVLSSKVDGGKLRVIVAEETMILKHAVTFTQAQSILYFTSSETPSENEDLVLRTLREYREETTARNPFDLAPFLPDLVDNLRTHVQENSDGLSTIFSRSDDKYLLLKPSSRMNGCFIALMKRVYTDANPRAVIERHSKKHTKKATQKKPPAQKYGKESKETDDTKPELSRETTKDDPSGRWLR